MNPASALGFLDVFIRDLTHERPLHPETLRFLAAERLNALLFAPVDYALVARR